MTCLNINNEFWPNRDVITIKDDEGPVDYRFAQMPLPIMCDPAISLEEKTVYTMIMGYHMRFGKAFPSQRTLANQAGISIRKMFGILKSMTEKGLIMKIARGDGQTIQYAPAKIKSIYPFLSQDQIGTSAFFLNFKQKFLKSLLAYRKDGTVLQLNDDPYEDAEMEQRSDKWDEYDEAVDDYCKKLDEANIILKTRKGMFGHGVNDDANSNVVSICRPPTHTFAEGVRTSVRTEENGLELKNDKKDNNTELKLGIMISDLGDEDLGERDGLSSVSELGSEELKLFGSDTSRNKTGVFNSGPKRAGKNRSEIDSDLRSESELGMEVLTMNQHPDKEVVPAAGRRRTMDDVVAEAKAKAAAARAKKRERGPSMAAARALDRERNQERREAPENALDAPKENSVAIYHLWQSELQSNFGIDVSFRKASPADLKKIKRIIEQYGFQKYADMIKYACADWKEIRKKKFLLKEIDAPMLETLTTIKHVDDLMVSMLGSGKAMAERNKPINPDNPWDFAEEMIKRSRM